MPKPVFVRVKDKNNRSEYTVALCGVRAHHEVIDKPATDPTGRPLPPKPFAPHKGAGKRSPAPAASPLTPAEPAESQEG